MHFELSSSDTRPLYIQIMDEVKRGIVIGTVRADEALPSVRQLALDLRINPNTVQQAYRELEREGVVYVRRGQGTYIAQNSGGSDERAELVVTVADRAARDAFRHGLSLSELINALRARQHPDSNQ